MRLTPNPSGTAELEASRWLPLALLATGTLSAAVTPHAPLAAFAAMSGVILKTRKAIGVAGLIWLIDQVAGVGLRGYPIGPLSLTWAVVMAAGTAAVALLASTASHPMTQVHALGGSRGSCAFDTARHGGKASLPTLL